MKPNLLFIKYPVLLFFIALLNACSNEDGSDDVIVLNPHENPFDGISVGNPNGNSPIPSEASLEDVSNPDTVIGNGTPESCTGQLVIDAVSKGGKIVFDCGQDPITITLSEPAKVFNLKNSSRLCLGV